MLKSFWCFLIKQILESAGVRLHEWLYGLATALAVSCPIISELWVYYLHNGIAIAYGLTALALLLFLQSLRHDGCHSLIKTVGSGVCLAMALGCYVTMMDCFLIGALAFFMILHALSDRRENEIYTIRFLPWAVRGGIILAVSMGLRIVIHKALMAIYHLDNMALYGMNDYNPVFGDLFVTPGALGMLIKKMYLRYFVNGVAYLPVAFFVLSFVMISVWAFYFAIRKKDLWVIVCVPAMILVPVLSNVVGGGVKEYRSAQFVPIVIMLGFLFCAAAVYSCNGLQIKFVRVMIAAIASAGIIVQIKDMNKWFIQDYKKYLEAKQIMTDVAENLVENYDIRKPIVVVGATLLGSELCQEASISYDSWKYRIITGLTAFDPTIKVRKLKK